MAEKKKRRNYDEDYGEGIDLAGSGSKPNNKPENQEKTLPKQASDFLKEKHIINDHPNDVLNKNMTYNEAKSMYDKLAKDHVVTPGGDSLSSKFTSAINNVIEQSNNKDIKHNSVDSKTPEKQELTATNKKSENIEINPNLSGGGVSSAKQTSQTKDLPSFQGNLNPVVANKQEKKSENIITKTSKGVSQGVRGLEAIFSKDYKDYKVNTNGKDNLKQFSGQELKFLNRDYKIANKDNTQIKAELKERKIDTKAFNKSAGVETLYNVKTDKASVSLGVDKKNGNVMISKNHYKNNENIKTWEPLQKGDLSKALISQGAIKELHIDNKVNSINRPDVSNSNLSKIQSEISEAVSKGQANNHIKTIDSASLKEPKELVGQIVRTEDKDNKQNLYKVLAADDNNITIQPITGGKDSQAYLVNVKTEREQAVSREVQLTGILDNKTVIGHNHTDNNTYIGTVNNDKSVDWKTQDDYLKSQSPKDQNKINEQLQSGDFRLNNVTPVGRIDGGNILYAAEKANKEIVLTANQETWVNGKESVGKALLELSNTDLTKVKQAVAENSRSPQNSQTLESNIDKNQGQGLNMQSFAENNRTPQDKGKDVTKSLSL